MTGHNERLTRQARNEALFREVNEQIAGLGERTQVWSSAGGLALICECGVDGGCGERVEMTPAEYERVRTQDDRFALIPGHETPALERIVERTERYVIVDKVDAAEPLIADDPRGAPSR